MARVQLHQVTKRYGAVDALRDLTLEVEDGEFLVLVGPSGCGKSTALRLVAGLEDVTAGDLYIGDRRVNELPPKDRDVAMVFQSYALYPHMSVYENLAFGLKLRHLPASQIAARVRETAALLGISELLDRRPKQLSGGQRQRVALGRAIVREPQVFLMDEPLSNLDAQLRVDMRAEIRKLHQRLGVTTIYVTHDQVEAMTMGDRIAVLRDGVLQQLDTPMVVYDRPRNQFVAGFIGSPAMNFFRARLTGNDGGYALAAASFTLQVPAQRAAEPASLTSPSVEAGGRVRPAVQDVIAGIRPEHLHIRDPAEPGAHYAMVSMAVEVIEPMGSQTLLHLRIGADAFTALVDPRVPASPGMSLEVAFALDRLHFFDAASKASL